MVLDQVACGAIEIHFSNFVLRSEKFASRARKRCSRPGGKMFVPAPARSALQDRFSTESGSFVSFTAGSSPFVKTIPPRGLVRITVDERTSREWIGALR